MQGRNNAVLCTIAQMANKREKDLLGWMKEPMVEQASASKGVGQGSRVVSQDPILDKEVSVVTRLGAGPFFEDPDPDPDPKKKIVRTRTRPGPGVLLPRLAARSQKSKLRGTTKLKPKHSYFASY